jgi:hypothetical protein
MSVETAEQPFTNDVDTMHPGAPCQADWRKAIDILQEMLRNCDGRVSKTALRKALEECGIQNAADLCGRLKFYDHESVKTDSEPRPSFRWRYKGRSFLSEEAFDAANEEAETAAEAASEVAAGIEDTDAGQDDSGEESPRRQNRQEEARLVTYVKDALETIYASEWSPDDDCGVSFDVHNERAGSAFENIDVIAVHWRSKTDVELVTVEVKLAFSAGAVQQAVNYSRFAHRVWIAVPINSTIEEASLELRESDPRLFEYVISMGVGILGCRRGRGRCYNVYPLHWPQLNALDVIERAEFIERHRATFEEADVIERTQERGYPKLR